MTQRDTIFCSEVILQYAVFNRHKRSPRTIKNIHSFHLHLHFKSDGFPFAEMKIHYGTRRVINVNLIIKFFI